MEDEDQMILDNIDEFISDEMKIVTYKWLSLTLSLHVNKARSFLEEYLKKTDNQLDVIYFVGGNKKNGLYKTFQYKLARQDSLDDVKSAFDEVTTCHIYSIQKSKIKDADVLYANDFDIVKESLSDINKYSAIQCDFLTKKSQDRIVPPVINGCLENKDHDFKPIQKVEIKKPQPAKPDENKSKNKKEAQSNKKETTATSFFGKKGPGKKAVVSTSKPEDASKQDKPTELQNKSDKPTETKDKSGGKSKVETAGISGAFAKSKKTVVDISKPDIASKQDEPAEPQDQINKPSETESKTSEKAKVENVDITSATTKKIVQSEATPEDIVEVEEKDSPVKKKERRTKKKKENDISPVKEENDISPVKEEKVKVERVPKEKEKSEEEKGEVESVPKEKGKSGKRKAVISDSESDEDNFEQFLSKSKEPPPKRPAEKKISKPVYIIKVDDTAGTDDDEDDEEVIAPTPEPEKKKKKRRRTEKNESSKDKEKSGNKGLTKDTKFRVKVVDQKDNDGKKKRGRRMVMKSKQYADEEGFMVTKKEYESESFTDESDTDLSEEKIKALSPERKKEVEKKKVVINLEKKANEHSSKPKHQASLMNFFKKK